MSAGTASAAAAPGQTVSPSQETTCPASSAGLRVPPALAEELRVVLGEAAVAASVLGILLGAEAEVELAGRMLELVEVAAGVGVDE